MAHGATAEREARYLVSIGDRGRIVLPTKVRAQLGLHEGDQLALTVGTDGSLRLVAARAPTQQALGMYKHLKGDRSIVDELIADRRQEVRREEVNEERA